jgi:hypothetical protein
MALALNIFKTVTGIVSTSPTIIYTAPVGYTGVSLLAQVANVNASSEDVTLIHRRSSTDTRMLKDYPVSGNDTVSLFSGKLFLESGDKLVLSGSNGTNLEYVVSILETLN